MRRKSKGSWRLAADAAKTPPEKEPEKKDAIEKAPPSPAMIPTKTVAIINTIYGLIWLAIEILKALQKP